MAIEDGEVGASLVEVIGDGAIPKNELPDRLAEAGHEVSRDQIESVLQRDMRFNELSAGTVYTPSLLEGVAVSLQVSSLAVENQYLELYPALEVLGWWLVDDPVDLYNTEGQLVGSVRVDGRMIGDIDTDVLVGPDKWLAGLENSWVSFRVNDGALVLERLGGPPKIDPARPETIRKAFDRAAVHHSYHSIGSDEPLDITSAGLEEVFQEAVLLDRPIFLNEPLQPEELISAAGFRLQSNWVVPDDLDPETFADAEHERQLMARWGVDADTARSARILKGVMSLYVEGNPNALGKNTEEHAGTIALLTGLLDRESVATVMGYEWNDPETCDSALQLANLLHREFEDPAKYWAPTWLVAHCYLGKGNIDTAAILLDQLPSLLDQLPSGITCLPVLVDRAQVAASRSQAKVANQLLLQAQRIVDGMDEISLLKFGYQATIEELSEEVEFWTSNPAPVMARRNDRCPCGSGRKYKVCHLGSELHPIEERSLWLYEKLTRFARKTEPEMIHDLAWVMADAMGRPDQIENIVDELLETLFVTDPVLHEEGLEQRFLEGRSETLPGDEVLLAQSWMLVDRSVFEIESAGPEQMDLRDLATGETLNVHNITPHQNATSGSLLLGRPLPVGEIYRAFSGFIPVPPNFVTEVLEMLERGNPYELMEFVGSTKRPPEIRNSDGHEIQPTDITWLVTEGENLAQNLENAGFKSDGNDWTLVRDTKSQKDALIAMLQIRGDHLVGNVNSDERAQELFDLIAEYAPEAVHLDTTLIDPDEFDPSEVPSPADQAELLEDPSVRAAVEEHLARYETEWLDTPIPALKDLTPREAAANPIAREDLIRLLATFPEVPDGEIGMSPGRLREALGL